MRLGPSLVRSWRKAEIMSASRYSMRCSARPISQPSEARHMTIDATAVSAYGIGDRVFHQKFGYGVITQIEGNKLEIDFDQSGHKRVIDSFVTST